jgi:hypothetical protein
MAREQWEKSTFGGTRRPPRDPQRGHSKREVMDKRYFDNEPSTGCGGILLLCLCVLGSILAAVLS